jgi:hypothetical protein
MAFETVDDIVEQLANQFNRYGVHDEAKEEGPRCMCRMCFTTGLADRIREAVFNEQALAAGRAALGDGSAPQVGEKG